MAVTYRNNRLVPAVIIATCLILTYMLIDPAVENYGHVIPSFEDDKPSYQFTEIPSQDDHTSSDSPSTNVTTSHEALQNDDILLIMKTGGTTLWKRLLIHLTTTLTNTRIHPSNIAIYSDQAETISDFTIIDALANSTSTLKETSPDYAVYREQAELNAYNYYVEAAGVNGDEWGPVGGWILDKYKFLPLVKHAGENWPRAKWYVYMEDDAYLFLPNIRHFLAQFDPQENHYLGSYAAKSNAIFAHGGAGFALSRGAWEASFGASPNIVEDYQKYTEDHCCGDQVLGLALKDHGVRFGENGGDEGFTWGFNPLVHWSFAFSRSNWCKPLLSWHKVHARDVARYYELERNWDFSKPLLYKDFFENMILQEIQNPAEWWDNTASLYEISSSNQAWAPKPEDASSYNSKLWKKGWESVEDCEAACKGWSECAMWTFVEDLCKLDDKMVMGQGYAPSMSQRKTSLKHTSGWMTDRLEQWVC